MFANDALVEARIDRFVSERIRPAVHCGAVPLRIEAWPVPGEPVPFDDAVHAPYVEVQPGHAWGAAWTTTWFHVTGVTPPGWPREGCALELVADLGFTATQPGFQAEGLVHRPDGTIVKAVQPYNQAVPIEPGQVDLYLEAAGNPDVLGWPITFGPTDLGDGIGIEPLYRLGGIELRLRDLTVWELDQDVVALLGVMRELPADSHRRAAILRGLEAMVDAMDPDDVAGTAARGRQILAPLLAAPAHASAHRAYAIGHAHIDSAWLWPVRETIRKCARTFSNQIALMDEDPQYVFACSSAQQYAWIKERHPQLWQRIVEKVAAGQFVPTGSMWVESDTNLPGGEALARQLIAGKRFFLAEFGVETRDVWLPDSFGYTGALPQIARAAGCEWFMSQKLSWNETDAMPHHTFEWVGIDGSRLFAHFPPVDKYNAELSGAELAHAARNFRDKGAASMSIVPFGWGDGGGGPTREMLAQAHRLEDMEGSARVQLASPEQFFRDAQADYPHPPAWLGEMYLEFHRGTYTSQSRTKRGNRRSEHLLREAELWAATAAVRTGASYPYEALDRIWRTVLLHQFHDILPGSSIAWVHRQAEETYAAVAVELEAMIEAAGVSLAGEGRRRIALNAAPHSRDGVPALGGAVTAAPATAPVVAQPTNDGGAVLDNGLIRLTLGADGLFHSLRDLAADRETIPAGQPGNLLQLHRDTPRQWDAWDIDPEYRRVCTDLTQVETMELVSSDAAATVRVARTFGDSRVVQDITVRRGAPLVEIVTDVEWHETQKLLKLAFPLDVLADRSAAETQFGHVWRPTHGNTSWDAAKFEICAHRWLRVAEAGYGVAIANDATYGHDATLGAAADGPGLVTTVRLSLLRAPLFPDPQADQGRHRFTVTLHPGASIADAVADGYRVNLPVRVVRGERDVEPLIAVSNPAIVVEAVKLADDRSGDVIVRLYESLGGHATGILTAQFESAGVRQVDLLERDVDWDGAAASSAGEVALSLRPFQLMTLRLTPQP